MPLHVVRPRFAKRSIERTTRRLSGRRWPTSLALAGVLTLHWADPSLAQSSTTNASGTSAPVAASRTGLRLSSGVQQANAWGSTVAVLDTGINTEHEAFLGRLAGGAYEVFAGTSDVRDVSWHGTAVASVIARARDASGKLYDPRILPIRIFDGPTTWGDSINAGLAYSAGRAPIVNLSFAAPNPIAEAGIREAVAARQLVVAAAGNRGAANPDWPARYALNDWANGQVIVVGAIDASNQMASFSNRAGDTRDFYLVANGVSVTAASSSSNSGWVMVSGTSLATPVVSAAAAMVQARWPYLSATQIAGILFTTATDLGAPGVDDVYGRGKLDLDRALQPIGPTVIPLASGTAVALSAASLDPGFIAGSGLRAAAQAGALQSVALDAFGRAYVYDLGEGLAPARALTHEQIFGATDRTVRFSATKSPSGTRTLIGAEAARTDLALGAMQGYESRHRSSNALAGMAIVQPVGAQSELAYGSMGMAASYFGVHGSGDEAGPAITTLGMSSSLPYLNLAPGHHHVAMGWRSADGIHLKYGIVSNASQATPAIGRELTGTRPATHAAVFELSRQSEAGAAGLTVQQIRETDSHFGMIAGDAYRLTVRPATTAFTVFGRYRLAEHWTLAGQYSFGLTPAQSNTADSLIQRFSAIRSDAFALGLARDQLWRAGDQLSVVVSQPMRASAGSMQLDLPTAVDVDGRVLRASANVGLVPGGRELLTELAYSTPLNKHTVLGFSYLNRRQPNHDANAPTERVYAARLRVTW